MKQLRFKNCVWFEVFKTKQLELKWQTATQNKYKYIKCCCIYKVDWTDNVGIYQSTQKFVFHRDSMAKNIPPNQWTFVFLKIATHYKNSTTYIIYNIKSINKNNKPITSKIHLAVNLTVCEHFGHPSESLGATLSQQKAWSFPEVLWVFDETEPNQCLLVGLDARLKEWKWRTDNVINSDFQKH